MRFSLHEGALCLTISPNRVQPDRSKIDMHEDYEVKHWTHTLGVSKEDLQKAVDKVGNSAAAVRKELGLQDGSRP